MKNGTAHNFTTQAYYAEQRRDEMMRRLRGIPGVTLIGDEVLIPASGTAEAEQAVRDILFRDVTLDSDSNFN